MRIAVITGASSGMGRDAARMVDAGYDYVKLLVFNAPDACGAEIYEQGRQDNSVCFVRSVCSAAEICGLCCDQGLCIQLFPCSGT